MRGGAAALSFASRESVHVVVISEGVQVPGVTKVPADGDHFLARPAPRLIVGVV